MLTEQWVLGGRGLGNVDGTVDAWGEGGGLLYSFYCSKVDCLN